MDTNEQIRQEIRQAMKRRNLTQRDVAETLGIKQPSVAQILSGTRGTVPQSLLDVLGTLDLTLCVCPKNDAAA